MLPKVWKCGKCKLTKPSEEFYWDSHWKKPLYTCKICHNKKSRDKSFKDYLKSFFKTKQGKEAWNRASKISQQKFPEKWKARTELRKAVKRGDIVKPSECENCSISDTCFGRIEAHHPDYNKPLEVKWLCVKHHKDIHRIYKN